MIAVDNYPTAVYVKHFIALLILASLVFSHFNSPNRESPKIWQSLRHGKSRDTSLYTREAFLYPCGRFLLSTFSFSSFLLKEESERNWTERAKRRKGFARCAQIRQYRICLSPQGVGVVVRSHVRLRDFSKTEVLSGSALLCEIFRFRLRMLSFRQQGIFHCGANKTSFFYLLYAGG